MILTIEIFEEQLRPEIQKILDRCETVPNGYQVPDDLAAEIFKLTTALAVSRGYIAPVVSRGLGDMLERVFVATGVKRIVGAIERVTGKSCGCDGRRDTLNKLFPIAQADAARRAEDIGL